MSEQKPLIVKEFSLEKQAVMDLKEINAALIMCRRMMAGMQVNLDYALHEEYGRCGIELDGPKGYKRHITYNTETQKITVSDILEPIKKEEAKVEPKTN